MFVLNMTQTPITAEQAVQGVWECRLSEEIFSLLTFGRDEISVSAMMNRASRLAEIAIEARATIVLINGPEFFMPHVEVAMRFRGIMCYTNSNF
jgi:hypothetical protein